MDGGKQVIRWGSQCTFMGLRNSHHCLLPVPRSYPNKVQYTTKLNKAKLHKRNPRVVSHYKSKAKVESNGWSCLEKVKNKGSRKHGAALAQSLEDMYRYSPRPRPRQLQPFFMNPTLLTHRTQKSNVKLPFNSTIVNV